MSLLFETIKVVDQKLFNINYHNERVNSSRTHLFNANDRWDLSDMIQIPGLNSGQTYKCRVVYSDKIEVVEFIPYNIRPLRTLKLVECPEINYQLKFTNRSALEKLRNENSGADDVIIVKNNQITDCTYANIVFFDGIKWITPAFALLNGTKRQKYIDESRIYVDEITVRNLKSFKVARIINAMIDLEECPDILIENIY